MKLFMFGVIFRPFGVFVCVLLRPQFLKGEMPRHARGFASWNSLPKLFVMCGVFGSPSLQTHRAQPEHNGLLDAHQLDGDLQLLSQRLSEGFTHLTRKSTARRFPTQNQHMREALDRHCACDVCVCVEEWRAPRCSVLGACRLWDAAGPRLGPTPQPKASGPLGGFQPLRASGPCLSQKIQLPRCRW